MSAPSSSHSLGCRRIWYRLDQIVLASLFGSQKFLLEEHQSPCASAGWPRRGQFCRPVRMPPAGTPIPPRCGSCQNPDPRAATKFATNYPGAAAGLGARSRARTFAGHRRAAQGTMALSREELLMKLGAARDQSRTAWRLVTIEIAADSATFSYR